MIERYSDLIKDNVKARRKLSVRLGLPIAFASEGYADSVLSVDSYSFFLARYHDEKKKGLAGLDEIILDGLVFVNDVDVTTPFTMQGMKFDIDITFIDFSGNVVGSYRCKKDRQEPVRPEGSYRYVLESTDLSREQIEAVAKKIAEKLEKQ